MNVLMIPVFIAATMFPGMMGGGHRHHTPVNVGPRPVIFALVEAQNYCLRKLSASFQIVARHNPTQHVAEVNRPFSDQPQDGVVFQIYERAIRNDLADSRETLTPVTLANCPKSP